jgi:hypothetical protein
VSTSLWLAVSPVTSTSIYPTFMGLHSEFWCFITTNCQWWILQSRMQRSALHCTTGLSWHFLWSCRHFVRYEGATTAVGIEIVGLMMLLRWNLFFLLVSIYWWWRIQRRCNIWTPMGCHRAGGVLTAILDCSDCMATKLWWTYGFTFATQRMSLRHRS